MEDTLYPHLQQPGIYLITNRVNGKQYVGQAINIAKRWGKHRGTTGNQLITRAIRKHGIDNFAFDVIEFCDKAQLDELETLYISITGSAVPSGYNIQVIGRSNKGLKYSEESCRKISNAVKAVYARPGMKEKYKAAHSRPDVKTKRAVSIKAAAQRPDVKKKRQESMRIAWSRPALKERHRTGVVAAFQRPEVKENLRVAMEKVRADPSVQAKISVGLKAAFSHPDVRAKRSAQRKLENQNPEIKARRIAGIRAALEKPGSKENRARVNKLSGPKRRKPIAKFALSGELVATYDSLQAAAATISQKARTAIGSCAKGRTKSAYGYIWRFVAKGQISFLL